MSGGFRKSPLFFRSLNAMWRSTYPLGGRVKLEKGDLINRARKKTGLKDFGKDFNEEPLEKLLWSLNEEACLHPAGRFITRERLTSLLSIRLRAEYYFAKYPDILEQELYPLWIIIGLQRTGTTKLHRMLATDNEHRVIPSWEVINPVPLKPHVIPGHEKGGSWGEEERIRIARTAVRAVRIMSPDFFAIHPIDPMQPEEDILLLDVSFLSTTPEAITHVPSYAAWLERTDQSEAYAYAARLLKFLQWIRPARRWVLKTPHHLEFPDLIEKHFGKVLFIWPHRSIYESVPSFLSMVTCNRMMFSNRVDPVEVARHWVRKTGYMLERALQYRGKDDNERKFIDIMYHDLIRDSIGEMEKIYRFNGGMTPELASRFRHHEVENPHRKHGIHRYSPADFGLTQADIDQYTQKYQQFMMHRYAGK